MRDVRNDGVADWQKAGLREVSQAGAAALSFFLLFVAQVGAAACQRNPSSDGRYIHHGVSMVWALDATVTCEIVESEAVELFAKPEKLNFTILVAMAGCNLGMNKGMPTQREPFNVT